MQFKEKDMTPICRSLLHLTSKSQDEVSQEEQMYCSLFLLRHFPQLQKLTINVAQPNELTRTTSVAVQLLCQSKRQKFIPYIEASFKKKQIKWNFAPSFNLRKKLCISPNPTFFAFLFIPSSIPLQGS
jgi:hypothetical protein